MSDFEDAQDATAAALAQVLVEKADGDTMISAQSLVQALATLGVPVAIKGLAAESDEEGAMFFGMSKVIRLLMDGLDVTIARDQLERL